MAVLNDAQLVELRPLAIATIWYFVLFYAFMTIQSFSHLYLAAAAKSKKKEDGQKTTSLREIKYGGNKKGLSLLADRTFLNLFEQSVPFLTSVWLYGTFNDAAFAAKLAYFYIFFRLLYPFVFRSGPPVIFVSTFPNYLVIFYCFGAVGLRLRGL